MKYYGFKFEKITPTTSKINREVGTWIGILGTILFLIGSAEAGGFRGNNGTGFWLAVFYPGIVWYLNSLAEHRRWAKVVIIYLSALASIFALISITMGWLLYAYSGAR